MTLSITTKLSHYAECHYAECRGLYVAMLSVVMLNVIMLSVVMPSVVAPTPSRPSGNKWMLIYIDVNMDKENGKTVTEPLPETRKKIESGHSSSNNFRSTKLA